MDTSTAEDRIDAANIGDIGKTGNTDAEPTWATQSGSSPADCSRLLLAGHPFDIRTLVDGSYALFPLNRLGLLSGHLARAIKRDPFLNGEDRGLDGSAEHRRRHQLDPL